MIPANQGPQSGLESRHVQRSAKYGGGYVVNVEGMHHLHCLNLLRQALYYNYDYYKALGKGAFKNEGDVLRLHVCTCPMSFFNKMSHTLLTNLPSPSSLRRHPAPAAHVPGGHRRLGSGVGGSRKTEGIPGFQHRAQVQKL